MKNMAKDNKLVPLLAILVGSSKLVTGEEGIYIPVSVHRRLGGDSFQVLNSSDQLLCYDDNNLTYLVHERRCVKSQELLSGKSYRKLAASKFCTMRSLLGFGGSSYMHAMI